MKNLIRLVMAPVLMLSLVACSGGGEGDLASQTPWGVEINDATCVEVYDGFWAIGGRASGVQVYDDESGCQLDSIPTYLDMGNNPATHDDAGTGLSFTLNVIGDEQYVLVK